MEEISYSEPTLDELSGLCELNKYLFNLNVNEFDNTLNQNWTSEESYTESFKKYFCNDEYFILFAKDNSILIGYVSGSIYNSDSYRKTMKIAELENLMVLPEYQSKGIGLKLSKKFEAWAKNKGAERFRVNVYAKNHDAHSFYKRLGYEDYDINMEKDL